MIQLSCRWLLTSFRASFLSCSCLINSASLIFICSSIILLVSFICTTVSSWFKIKNQIFKKMCLGAYSLWTVWCHKCDFIWQVKIYQIMFTTGPLNMQCVSFISKVYQQRITFLTNISINWIYMCRYIWSVVGYIVKRWICL